MRIWSFYAVMWIELVVPQLECKNILDVLLMIPMEQQCEYPLESHTFH